MLEETLEDVIPLDCGSEDESDTEDTPAIVQPQTFGERGARQMLYHMRCVSEFQEQNVSPDFIMGIVDPNCLEHVDSGQTPSPSLIVTDMPSLSEEQEDKVRRAGKLLSEAGELAVQAHQLLTKAEMVRGEAYQLLVGLEDDPLVRHILDPEYIEFPDGIETHKSNKQLTAEVLSTQEPTGSGVDTDATVVYDVKKAKRAVARKARRGVSATRKLSTGSVVSTGKRIHGYKIPDDFPESWPLKYRPHFVGGGPLENRVYICQFPKCGKRISKLDPSWSHLARHMKCKAKCPLCMNASYWNPCGMRAHMRTCRRK
jgi:hypothetical protein